MAEVIFKEDEEGLSSYSAVVLQEANILLSGEKQARLTEKGIQPQPIQAGIRPEHISLIGNADQMAHGTVDGTEMMGSAVHVHACAWGKDTIIIVRRAHRRPHIAVIQNTSLGGRSDEKALRCTGHWPCIAGSQH